MCVNKKISVTVLEAHLLELLELSTASPGGKVGRGNVVESE